MSKDRSSACYSVVGLAAAVYWQWAIAEPTTVELQVSGWTAFAGLVVCLLRMLRAIE